MPQNLNNCALITTTAMIFFLSSWEIFSTLIFLFLFNFLPFAPFSMKNYFIKFSFDIFACIFNITQIMTSTNTLCTFLLNTHKIGHITLLFASLMDAKWLNMYHSQKFSVHFILSFFLPSFCCSHYFHLFILLFIIYGYVLFVELFVPCYNAISHKYFWLLLLMCVCVNVCL